MSLTGSCDVERRTSAAKVTPQSLLAQKQRGASITAITAYDYPMAHLVDEAGIDLLLVGDSLGMAVLGYKDTLRVTMEDMLHHARAVRRAVRRAMVVVDMPYGSYQVSVDDTLRNALRFVKESGSEAVKLEGGSAQAERVRALTGAEIPVVGHIGLTPQSVFRMGGYRVQGRSAAAATELCDDALALEQAGAIALVLEGIPRELAARITSLLTIPTIGIGAGPDCDGQILVFHDLFSLSFRQRPKFVRPFGDAAELIRNGLGAFRAAVETRSFPSDQESYHMPAKVSLELSWALHASGSKHLPMQILGSINEMRRACKAVRRSTGLQTLALVPTMGALHEGHLSLVHAARKRCDRVAVTIFVNPLQFGPSEDFAKYPRTFDDDCTMLEREGVDPVFAPTVEEMYPAGAETWVDVPSIGSRLDGGSRPGHFRGVATIVSKLFHIAQPDQAFFGQKDAAQVAVLRAMVRDLNFGVEIVVCPTVREEDGLALSSRNRYLSAGNVSGHWHFHERFATSNGQ